MRGPGYWAELEHVCDDGRQITLSKHEGDWRRSRCKLDVWDVSSKSVLTPVHWEREEWRNQSRGSRWYGASSGLRDLLKNPSGRAFLHDGPAWSALEDRFVHSRAKALDDLQKTLRPVHGDEGGELYPNSAQFSIDGRFVCYVARNGWPIYGSISESLGDSVIIEDVRTGERIAELPGLTQSVEIAPGGSVAVSGGIPKPSFGVMYVYENDGDQPQFWLWDLKLSRVRAILWAPGNSYILGFSRDGRFVFAGDSTADLVRWWDTETGLLVGEVDDFARPLFLDGGKTVVFQFQNDPVLHYWDVGTGAKLGKWEPIIPVNSSAGQFTARGSDRFLVADLDTNVNKATSRPVPFLDEIGNWISRRLPDGPSSQERQRILVIDAIDQRELGHVPGLSAAISDNGRWIATIDAHGVVRVWELPLRRPWLKSCRNAALFVYGGWVVLILLGKLRRRIRSWGEPTRGA